MNESFQEEDQFKEKISAEEVSLIKDPQLKEIRMKYLSLRQQAIQDEHRISDYELGNEFDRLELLEMKEIARYRESINTLIT